MKQLYIKSIKLIVLLLLVSVAGVQAQALLSGKVSDKESTLTGVSVNVSGVGGTITNVDGKYSLKLAKGSYTVTFSYIGYLKVTKQVTITNDDVVLDIVLVSEASALNEVVVLGGRGAGRTKMESAVPVDVVYANQANQTTAKPDLMSQLNQAVPSFNYNKQSGGDGSDAIDFASLRGLGFDQTLVLVNGKRRHLSAFVNEVGTRGRGNSGTDLNAIPEAAIDHVEILRDGASAQYGSDAIAGVINIVLKKDINHLNVTGGFSGYDDQKYNTLNNVDPAGYYTGNKFDGQTFTLGGDYGIAIGKNGGFLNIGANYENQGKTFRAIRDTNWQTNPNTLEAQPVARERRAFGDGSVVSGGGMYNMEIPIKGTNTTFYSFGGYNYKHSNVYAYTRSWNYDNGLRSNPTKFPTDANGNLIFVPGIMKVDGAPDGSIGPNNVYYDPQEDVYIKDLSAAVGFRGKTESDWEWDISNNLGRNDFHYWGDNTFNASLPYVQGQPIQTRFDDGGFNFLQNTANADITKRIKGVAQGLQLSFGAEFRYERYQLYAGEPNSYRDGGALLPVIGSKGQDSLISKASGSEGYPGYQPSDASIAHRTNEALYAEGALDVTKDWLVDGAARVENYSDFGGVSTFKLATRYKATDNFNLRGSISTGFRAPSLQQLNFSNTNTTVIGGNLVYTKLVPNYSEIARTAGIPKLKQETSTNYSLGFTWQPVPDLAVTVDAYEIKVKNRIVISGLYQQGDAALGTSLNSILASQGIGDAQFFANAVNTSNKGIDFVIDYKKRWGSNHFTALLAGNIQGLTIDKINIPSTFKGSAYDSATFFSDREQYFLKASAPKAKFTLNLEYGVKKLSFGTRFTYYGDVKELGFGETSAPANAPDPFFPYVTLDATGQAIPEIFDFSPKVTTDIYASLKINKNLLWTLGIDNLFNVHPNTNVIKGSVNPNTGSSFGDSESGGPFEAVQMGFNGMRIFTKLTFNF
ncbi:MAG TPA: TonB-dependent receptor [Mucilaginibacter sp.]|jgi:iron complex outermembrane receptor protein|nr:TonB-dependent receptor [Mucilaginibacter sp.]